MLKLRTFDLPEHILRYHYARGRRDAENCHLPQEHTEEYMRGWKEGRNILEKRAQKRVTP